MGKYSQYLPIRALCAPDVRPIRARYVPDTCPIHALCVLDACDDAFVMFFLATNPMGFVAAIPTPFMTGPPMTA